MSFTLKNTAAYKQILNGHTIASLASVPVDALSEDALDAAVAGKATITLVAANSRVNKAMTVHTLVDSSGGTSATASAGSLTVPAHGANSTATLITLANAMLADMKNMWEAIASIQKQLNQNQVVEQ